MAINVPFLKHPLTQTGMKILNLEASQISLPESEEIMKRAVGAYAATQAGAQMMEHSILGSLVYGVLSACVAYVSTYYLLRFLKQDDKFHRTLIALAGFGALAGVIYILLHLFFGLALPPPLPTKKLLHFLLFPIIVWLIFLYAFFYRHVGLRPVPAFAMAAVYVTLVEIVMSAIAF